MISFRFICCPQSAGSLETVRINSKSTRFPRIRRVGRVGFKHVRPFRFGTFHLPPRFHADAAQGSSQAAESEMTSTGLLRRRGTDPPPSPSSPTFPDDDDPVGETRDWAALPRDVLLDVFLRLGSSREIMRGAELACAPWRRVAVDEPALWRRVDMATVRLWSPGWREMVRAAVDRSAGQCAAFAGPADDDSLLYLVERYPSYLHSCCTCWLEQVLAAGSERCA